MGCCIGKLRKGPREQAVQAGFHRKPDIPVDKVVITESSKLPPSDVTYSSAYFPNSAKSFVTESPKLPPSDVTYSSAYFPNSANSFIPSSSSSTSSLKDRTFSNEFLVSCLKDNPQVVTKLNQLSSPSPTHSVLSSRTHPKGCDYRPKSSDQPVESRSLGHRTPQRLEWQKSPSPSPARRKCPITRDQETPKYYSSTRKAALLRSPSPSRRFNNSSTRVANYKVKRPASSKQASPFSGTNRSGIHGKHNHQCRGDATYAGSPSTIRQVPSSSLIGEMECMTLEDLDNPLISLDCFIFL